MTESANDLKAIEQFNALILHLTADKKFDPAEFDKTGRSHCPLGLIGTNENTVSPSYRSLQLRYTHVVACFSVS